jgi:hypothetical protein
LSTTGTQQVAMVEPPHRSNNDGLPQSVATDKSQSSDPDSLFHPCFPDMWQVSKNATVKVQKTKPDDFNNVELSLEASRELIMANDDNHQNQCQNVLLAGQIVSGRALGTAWIETQIGYLPRASTTNLGVLVVKPFWPTYRVVNNTHGASGGVAPYVYSSNKSNTVELPKLEPYDPSSPNRVEELTKHVGYVFENPQVPVVGMDPMTSNWWTNDHKAWWPKTIQRKVLLGNLKVPTKICGINVPPQKVTTWAVYMPPTYIQLGFQGRGYIVIILILMEYVMIVCGAIAGIEYGWSLGLQFVYSCCLLLFALCEVWCIAAFIPNGRFWLNINIVSVGHALGKSVLWRWDVYGDVGFAILAYMSREQFTTPLWIGATVIAAFVIAGRLLYSLSHMRKLARKVSVKSLAQVSVISFMLVFQLLTQMVNVNDDDDDDDDDDRTTEALSVKTELVFEILRFLCEDLPELGIKAAFLFGTKTLPSCTNCAYGFVVVSFGVSVCTAFPGMSRIFFAYQRYTLLASTKTKSVDHHHHHQVDSVDHHQLDDAGDDQVHSGSFHA